MRIAILSFSYSGNNRLLARHLAERLGADHEEIRDPRWFRKLRLPRDLSHDRRPPISPIVLDPTEYDHVVFVAPLFSSTIAPAMKTALGTWGRSVGAYSFVTFCGYHRDEQHDKIVEQLTDLAGLAPAHVAEICVGDLVSEKDRTNIFVVSNYRVRPIELLHFADTIDEIAAWFQGQNLSTKGGDGFPALTHHQKLY